MSGGRPVKYKTPEEMQIIIDDYFDRCIAQVFDKNLNKTVEVIVEPPTVSGLAYELNMTREGLVYYEAKDEFTDTIKRAKQRIQKYVERSLFTAKNPAGSIFNLKNNYGWVDKQDINVDVKHVSFVGEDQIPD